jgi:hypothetical protein
MGLEVTAVFERAGKKVERKKVKRGKTRRLTITKEEVINYIQDRFNTKILRKARRNE